MKIIEINDIGKYLDAAPLEMCTMFIGDTGIGKTQAITKYAVDHGYFLKTLILSQLEASETLGIPVQSTREYNGKVYNSIEIAIPRWVFELAEYEKAMLYLDEFLCAEPAVMNSFLNFLTERNVGGIDLSHVKVVAATNIGNYTYEPDTNILSRFCMFYTVNTTFERYLSNKYPNAVKIKNSYRDEEDLDGIIFEMRSLKPRCQEMLMLIKDRSLLSDFYEGYTNSTYMPIFHRMDKINSIVSAYAMKDDYGNWYLDDKDLDNIAANLYKQYVSTSKKQNKVEYCCRYTNLNYSKRKLMSSIDRIVAGVSSNNY